MSYKGKISFKSTNCTCTNFLKHSISLDSIMFSRWYKLECPYHLPKPHLTLVHEIFSLLSLTRLWTIGDSYYCSSIIIVYITPNMTKVVRNNLLFVFFFQNPRWFDGIESWEFRNYPRKSGRMITSHFASNLYINTVAWKCWVPTLSSEIMREVPTAYEDFLWCER